MDLTKNVPRLSSDAQRPGLGSPRSLAAAIAAVGLIGWSLPAAAIPASVGATYTGYTGSAVSPAASYEYSALSTGTTYSLLLEEINCIVCDQFSVVDFGVFKNGSATADFHVYQGALDPPATFSLTGLSALKVTVSSLQSPFEGYLIRLTAQTTGTGGNGVPEPATLALAAAGLLGGAVARRRKRR